MTRYKAQDTAKKIWGSDCTVTLAVFNGPTPPGVTQWWVDKAGPAAQTKGVRPIGRIISHGLDCNGHPTCHKECVTKCDTLVTLGK